jgi:hypothetical protein
MSLNSLLNKQINNILNKNTNGVINSISDQLNVSKEILLEIWNQLNPEFKIKSNKPLSITINNIEIDDEEIHPQNKEYKIEIDDEEILPQNKEYKIEIDDEEILPQSKDIIEYEIEIVDEDF